MVLYTYILLAVEMLLFECCLGWIFVIIEDNICEWDH